MADRTSAGLFSDMFEILEKYVPEGEQRDELARRFWDMTEGYDFSPYQMGCDDALLALGLAHLGVDPEYPQDGEVILYGPAES